MSESETPAGDTRKCPHCAEWIKAEAVVCRYCGRDVTPTVAVDAEPQAASGSEAGEEASTGRRKPWLIFVIVGVVLVLVVVVVVAVIGSSSGGSGSDDEWYDCAQSVRNNVRGEYVILDLYYEGQLDDGEISYSEYQEKVRELESQFQDELNSELERVCSYYRE